MNIQTLTSSEAQKQLTHLIANVNAENSQVRIKGENNATVRLVSEQLMDALDQLLEENGAFSDTLALMLNTEAQATIEQGRQEIASGNKIPFDELLQ